MKAGGGNGYNKFTDPVGTGVRAYNEGSDARLRGEPRCGNPYHGSAHQQQAEKWQEGWDDVDQTWGVDIPRLDSTDPASPRLWQPAALRRVKTAGLEDRDDH